MKGSPRPNTIKPLQAAFNKESAQALRWLPGHNPCTPNLNIDRNFPLCAVL